MVVEGWQQGTGRGILERIAELKAHVGGFLVTFVELEGRMGGTNLELAKAIVAAAGKDCRVTIAGGVTTADEIRALDEIGADAQVGMALYTGRLDLADAIMAPLVTDRPDGLYPTVVVDERGVCLGLVYSSQGIDPRGRAPAGWASTSPARAACGSRARPAAPPRSCCASTSTATATARASSSASPAPASATSTPAPAGARTQGLGRLARTLAERREQAPHGSYTAKLFADPELLAAKLREEANELAEARDREHVLWEAADVLYFTLARLAGEGIDLAEVEAHLDRRALKVTRRE